MAKKRTTKKSSSRSVASSSSRPGKKGPARRAPAKGKPARGAATRVETDSMGAMTVPAHVLYGATVQRAVLNFPVARRPLPPEIIAAFCRLKKAAAQSNVELKLLDRRRGTLIADACDDVLRGLAGAASGLGPARETPEATIAAAMEHFPVDVYQTGSGTSTNMNVNEVVSNLACLAAGSAIGAKDPIHPNDHVNMGQSSNDTFPTAMQVAIAIEIRERLVPALRRTAAVLRKKARAWDGIVKIGRTHLMDATPIRLGQEFSGYAAQVEYAIERAEGAAEAVASNLPIGGTAVGTGINTHPRFAGLVCRRLTKATKLRFVEAPNHFEAQATRDCVVDAHGRLKTIAVSLGRIASDIRLLGSGPRCGLFELALPATQPGSSIMPGKVNPVICESVVQVACRVLGNDVAVNLGGTGGVGSLLDLNVAMPMMADAALESIRLLANAADMFTDRCLDGLEVNREIAEGMVEKSLMMCTSLAPEIGYDEAARVAKGAFTTGRTVREYALEHGLVDPKRLDELLDPRVMTGA